jgi:hypothetical protein
LKWKLCRALDDVNHAVNDAAGIPTWFISRDPSVPSWWCAFETGLRANFVTAGRPEEDWTNTEINNQNIHQFTW